MSLNIFSRALIFRLLKYYACMKFFNFFKSKNKDEHSSETVPELNVNSWPSLPNENKQVPSLEVLSSGGPYSKESATVLSWGQAAVADGDEVQFQVVMESQHGLLTLPALVQRKDGGFLVFYSHCSEWDELAVSRLLEWTVKLRSCDFIHTLKIEICDSPENLPLKVREIISKRTEHRMFLSMLPHLSQCDPDIKARVFAEGFAYFFNKKKILNFDEDSLAQVDEWFKKTMRSIPRDSFYYQPVLNFLGSYFGRVLKESLKGEWGPGDFPEVEFHQKAKVRIHPYKTVADFIFNPRLENSLIRNYQLLAGELKNIS